MGTPTTPAARLPIGAAVFLLLVSCSGATSAPAMPEAPPEGTRATLAGPLCDGMRCECSGNPSAFGVPPQGFKRFQVELGPSRGQLWATIDNNTFYKSVESAKHCFVVDLEEGEHPMSFRATGPDGFGARFRIRELGFVGGAQESGAQESGEEESATKEPAEPEVEDVPEEPSEDSAGEESAEEPTEESDEKEGGEEEAPTEAKASGTPHLYETFDFECGASSVCDRSTLEVWKKEVAQFDAGKHAPCGSVRVLNLEWITGRLADNLYPRDFYLDGKLKVYKFSPKHPPRSSECIKGK